MAVRYWAQTAVESVFLEAAMDAAEDYMVATGQAAQALTPLKRGPLRETARVERPKPNTVTLKYGGPSAPYAAVQEQGFRNSAYGRIYFKKWTTPGTGPRYLERTFRHRVGDEGGMKPECQRFIQARVRAAMRRTP